MNSCNFFVTTLLVVHCPAFAFLGALLQPISLLQGTSGSRNTKVGQQLTCYDFPNRSGDSLVANNYISSLAEYNFDNRVESCCASGIWLLYSGNGFSLRTWWIYGVNYCTNLPRQFFNSVSSLRFTGAPDDMHFDTINFYVGEQFTGKEEYSYNDVPALTRDNQAWSAIVTGCSAWTVYQYDNYLGESACLFPSSTTSCTPGFFPTRSHLARLAGRISSVRRGCWSNERLFPVNRDAFAAAGGSRGFFE